jgi:hypothetical protein
VSPQLHKEMFGRIVIIAALVAVSGCGRPADSPTKEELAVTSTAVTQPTSQEDAQMEAQFLPSPKSRPAKSIQERLEGSVHAQLTAKLRMFKALKGRMPENFYEFANTVGDSVPRLPDGMKFAIDPTDETVKAVKK